MTTPVLSITEEQTFAALRAFLLYVAGAGVEVVIGQGNRTPAPAGPNYIVMTGMLQQRLSTNVTTYEDGSLEDPATPSVRRDLMPKMVTIQLDVHGALSADLASNIAELLRSDIGVDMLAASGYDVAPLYAGEPHQAPFVNGEQQVENCWMVDAVLQCNPVITTDQEFADEVDLGLVNVDVSIDADAVPVRRALAVRGKTIIGPDNKPITLRGWNWGRWGYTQPQDGHDNAQQGANIVRIPIRWWGLYDSPEIDSRDDDQQETAGIDGDHLAILDDMMAQADLAGLYIELFVDSNCGQNGTQLPESITYCDPNGLYPNGHNFWTDFDARSRFIDVWVFLANRYRGNPHWVIAEPQPEPAPPGVNPRLIREFYEELCAAIRAVVPGILFVVGGRAYQANQIGQSYMPSDPDIIYTADLFMHTQDTQANNLVDFTKRVADCTSFRDTLNRPVLIQQTGVTTHDDPDMTYIQAMLPQLNAAGLGWIWWEYRDTTQTNGFGAWYLDGGGNWIEKPALLNYVVSQINA